MPTPAASYSDFYILYVDDEQQSTKYFPKLFPSFKVLLANGVVDAQKVIDEQGDRIAVVLSDQRMPDGSGAELLGRLHRERPQIIRILTTAYSDLDSAIAAVNTGAVYRYVLKPWEQADLNQTLMRAYDLFNLQRERNQLLREKVSVLQRMVLMDRVRSFAVLATGLANRIKNPMEALKAFLDAAPPPAEAGDAKDVDWGQLWDMAQAESQRILDLVQGVVQKTVEPDYRFAPLDLPSLIANATTAAGPRSQGIVVEADPLPGDLPPINGDVHMLGRMLTILPERLLLVDPEAKEIRLRVSKDEVWGKPGIRIAVTAPNRDWTTTQLQACFTMLSEQPQTPSTAKGEGDLLAAYFIAYHHAGTMSVHRSSPNGPGFVTCIPDDPGNIVIPGVDPRWVERTLTWFEI